MALKCYLGGSLPFCVQKEVSEGDRQGNYRLPKVAGPSGISCKLTLSLWLARSNLPYRKEDLKCSSIFQLSPKNSTAADVQEANIIKIQLAVLNSGFSSPRRFWHNVQNQPEPAPKHDHHIPFEGPTPDIGNIAENGIDHFILKHQDRVPLTSIKYQQ